MDVHKNVGVHRSLGLIDRALKSRALVGAKHDLVLGALQEYCQPAVMTALLQDVLADEALAENLATNSMRHSLGFDQLLLASIPQYQVGLHYWRGGQSGNDDIHNHRFDFYSAIIVGELRASWYNLVSSGSQYECLSCVRGTEVRTPNEGLVDTELTSVTYMTRAGAYYTDGGEFHQVAPAHSAATVTMIVRLAVRRQFAQILVPLGAASRVEGQSATLTSDEYVSGLNGVISLISHGEGATEIGRPYSR